MAFNNNVLFNAAVIGFMEGSLEARNASEDVAADYAPLYAAAVSYATSLDGLIALDATLSGTGGVTLPPTTASITANQNAKIGLVRELSRAQFAGQQNTTATAGFYADQAAVVFAQYTEGVATFTANSSLA